MYVGLEFEEKSINHYEKFGNNKLSFNHPVKEIPPSVALEKLYEIIKDEENFNRMLEEIAVTRKGLKQLNKNYLLISTFKHATFNSLELLLTYRNRPIDLLLTKKLLELKNLSLERIELILELFYRSLESSTIDFYVEQLIKFCCYHNSITFDTRKIISIILSKYRNGTLFVDHFIKNLSKRDEKKLVGLFSTYKLWYFYRSRQSTIDQLFNNLDDIKSTDLFNLLKFNNLKDFENSDDEAIVTLYVQCFKKNSNKTYKSRISKQDNSYTIINLVGKYINHIFELLYTLEFPSVLVDIILECL